MLTARARNVPELALEASQGSTLKKCPPPLVFANLLIFVLKSNVMSARPKNVPELVMEASQGSTLKNCSPPLVFLNFLILVNWCVLSRHIATDLLPDVHTHYS